MKLAGMRFAESVTDPAGRRNLTIGMVQHLWRSPVPFLGFYPPEGVKPGGKWREVSVQVADGKAKTIRGYYP